MKKALLWFMVFCVGLVVGSNGVINPPWLASLLANAWGLFVGFAPLWWAGTALLRRSDRP